MFSHFQNFIRRSSQYPVFDIGLIAFSDQIQSSYEIFFT